MPPAHTRPDAEELHPPAFSISVVAVAVAVISSFLFGYAICVLNSCGVLMALSLEWCGDRWEAGCLYSQGAQALVNASIYLGAAMGAFLSGRPFLNPVGGRMRLIISDVCFAAGAISCALAQGVVALVIGRFASGLGLGLSAIAAPVYIAEISPRERRGLHCAMNGVFITLGIFASITFGLPQGPPPASPEQSLEGLDEWYWRFLLGFPAIPALLQALLFAFAVPVDPPSQLVVGGKIQQAQAYLYRIYGMPPPEGKVNMDDNKQALIELQLTELREAVTMAKSAPRIHIAQAICDKFFSTAVLLGFGLAAFQQGCGINALMSYSNILFEQAGISPASLTTASTMMAAANVFASIAGSKVVDKWGRRKLLLLGSAIQTVSMVLLTLSTGKAAQAISSSQTGPIAVICFTMYVMAFSFGLGGVTWLYLSEIYPMEVRGPALSACGVINWVCSFIVVFGTRFMTLGTACRTYGFICAVGCFGVYLWVIETKGCSLEDSPLTPKSGRSSSSLLSPNSPRVPFEEMHDDDDESDEDEHDAMPKGRKA
mmetsp:Transcript_63126/g.137203  ORF Transcript_63126/g.137203 Transcript_63126/m.137203 type:complete len:543 (-) Transcript_63126:244-1872(-)